MSGRNLSLNYSTWLSQQATSFVESASTVASELVPLSYSLYEQYVVPNMTQEYVASTLVSTISYTGYYTGMEMIGLGGNNNFLLKVGISMGFKTFHSLTTPILEQCVTKILPAFIHTTKAAYQIGDCYLSEQHCEEPKRDFSFSDVYSLFQFDTVAIQEDLNNNWKQLTPNVLLTGGILSATASEIKNAIYQATGLNQFDNNYWMKNWVSSYFKEFIKDQLKEQFRETFGKNSSGEKSLPENSMPISLEDVFSDTAPIFPMNEHFSSRLSDHFALSVSDHVIEPLNNQTTLTPPAQPTLSLEQPIHLDLI